MQSRKRPHNRSPSLRAAQAPPISCVNVAISGTYTENQRRARQRVLRDLLYHTSLAELRDREILRWLEDADGWLRSPDFLVSELIEFRLLVLGVLNTMPWWRILESVSPSQDQPVNEDAKVNPSLARDSQGATSQMMIFSSSTHGKQSSFASKSASLAISGIIHLHERIQLAFEKICLTLLEGSQRIIPNVLEAILKPFNLEPSVRDGAQRAIPADSILRILNQIATKSSASDVLNLFERCLPTLVPKQRWANNRHHVVCTTIFLYLALEGQVPGYHPSCGNYQSLAHMQELFEEWIPPLSGKDSVSSSPSPSVSHASSQGIRTRRDEAGEGGGDWDVAAGNRWKMKEEVDLVESKTDFALPPSLFSLAATTAPTDQGFPLGHTDTEPFQKVDGTGSQHLNPCAPFTHDVPREFSHEGCSGENPAPEGYDTSSSTFSGTVAAFERETVLKVPVRSALADFSDSEATNQSGNSDTNFGGQPRRDGVPSSLLSEKSDRAGVYGGDRAGPHTGASPKDILFFTAASHPASSTLSAVQTTPQNNRMLAYRSELIHFVLGRLEAMELSLDRAEGGLASGRAAWLPPHAGWEAARRFFRAETPSVGGASSSRMGSLPSTPRAASWRDVSTGPRAGPLAAAGLPATLVVDAAQPQYTVLRNCCAVVFYALAKDLRRQQAAGVCGNADWWRVLVGFQLRLLASASEAPVCLHYIAPSLAMFGQEEEAVDMLHKVVTLATKGAFPANLRGAASGAAAKEGFGRAPASMGSAAVGAPVRLRMAAPLAMATTQGISIPQRIRAAMSISPLFRFMKDRISNGEGVRKRLLKWVAQEMGREAAVAGGRGAFSRLVEVVFAQCAAISEMMGIEIVPVSNPNSSGGGAVEGGQTPLLHPFGGGAGKSVMELLQPLLDRYALNSDTHGGDNKVACEFKREVDNDNSCSVRMGMNLAQMECDGLLHPWLMDECPWGDLLARMISSVG